MKGKSLFVVVTFIIIITGLLSMGCPKGGPSTPQIISAPESTWINAPTAVKVFATAPGNKSIRYITDLGYEGKQDTSEAFSGGDTATIMPKWTKTGTYKFKVAAFLEEDPTKVSEFSSEKSIKVLPNNAPGDLKIFAPAFTARDVNTIFRATAVDPEGDSIQFYFDFGDGSKGWVDQKVASGETLTTTHKYTRIDTVWVKVKARDTRLSESGYDSVQVIIGAEGRVLKWFVGAAAEDSEPPIASPVIVDTVIYTYTSSWLYSIGLNSGGKIRDAYSRRGTEPDDYEYQGHPAYCQSTAHIIIGSDDAYLYAYSASNLNQAWSWTPDTLTDGWGTPAINGNKIYIPSELDSFYYLHYVEDMGSAVNPRASYRLPVMVSGAPVIDNSGYVIVGLINGLVYKLDPELNSVVWVDSTRMGSEITCLAIGDDGKIYVADEGGYVTALNSNGGVVWSQLVDAAGVSGLAVGPTRVFVTTGSGKVLALSQNSGSAEWTNTSSTNEIFGAPLLAANGYLYYVDDEDKLYCVKQDNGELVWVADCLAQVAGRERGSLRGRKLATAENASLSIGPNGNLVVIGGDYLYIVQGYAEGTLMQAPWPKWQKDLYNTGKK